MTTAGAAVIVLDERDYRYGAGELRLQVKAVDRADAVELDGELWLPVGGVQLRRDGTKVGPVRVFVRAVRLPAS